MPGKVFGIFMVVKLVFLNRIVFMSSHIGKLIILTGLILVSVGLIVYFFHDKLHWLGRLPGDVRIEREHFRFYFPVTTMVLFSILLTVVCRIAGKLLH